MHCWCREEEGRKCCGRTRRAWGWCGRSPRAPSRWRPSATGPSSSSPPASSKAGASLPTPPSSPTPLLLVLLGSLIALLMVLSLMVISSLQLHGQVIQHSCSSFWHYLVLDWSHNHKTPVLCFPLFLCYKYPGTAINLSIPMSFLIHALFLFVLSLLPFLRSLFAFANLNL